MRSGLSASALLLCCGLACQAQTIGPQVLFTEVATAPLGKRQVPGLDPGVVFESTSAGLALDRPYRSGNGQYWVIKASSSLATTEDDVIMLCEGISCHAFVREGTPTPFDPSRNWGLFDQKCSVNDSGTVVFANDLSGSTTDDELIAMYRVVGGVATFESLPFREGEPANAGPLPTGARWGININSPNIVNDERVAVNVALMIDANTTPPVTTANDQCLIFDTTVWAQQGVTTPVGGLNPWENIAAGDLHVDATGANWIALGDESGSTTTDGIVVVNGTVVLRENTTVIPSMSTPVGSSSTGLNEIHMTPSGDWFARGTNTDADEDWILRNGEVIACRKPGHPMNSVTGGTELWGNTDFAATYFLMTGNAQGDYVIGGVTNADLPANAVLVLDRGGVRTVIVREGDPLDLDDNGIYDDNVYIRTFGNDDAFLTDDGWLYFTATTTGTPNMGATGPDIGDALLRIRAFEPGPVCYPNCDGSTIAPILNVADFGCFLSKFAAGDPYANCDGSTIPPILNVADFGCFLSSFAQGCQ